MKFLFKFILNCFMFLILIIFFFVLDYKFVRLNFVEFYIVKWLFEIILVDSYYVIEFGEIDIFIEIIYLDGKIYLVFKSELFNFLIEENKLLIVWYYYVLGFVFVNIILFGWFIKLKKVFKKYKK